MWPRACTNAGQHRWAPTPIQALSRPPVDQRVQEVIALGNAMLTIDGVGFQGKLIDIRGSRAPTGMVFALFPYTSITSVRHKHVEGDAPVIHCTLSGQEAGGVPERASLVFAAPRRRLVSALQRLRPRLVSAVQRRRAGMAAGAWPRGGSGLQAALVVVLCQRARTVHWHA